jgi:hypothetical protein
MTLIPPDEPPPFRLYKKFFENDVHELPIPARQDLIHHLIKLQNNPFSPDFEVAEKQEGFYAMQFSLGFVLYWQLKMKGEKVVRIDVLKIAAVQDIL